MGGSSVLILTNGRLIDGTGGDLLSKKESSYNVSKTGHELTPIVWAGHVHLC
jgi:hypothetical protein